MIKIKNYLKKEKETIIMKNNKGFSLVELIIVIAIMAVLVGVLAPTYLQYVEKSKKSNDVSTVDSVINACEIGAIDPEVMTDTTSTLTITPDSMTITPSAEAGATGKWKAAVEAAVGTGADVKLKSQNWDGDKVIVTATRDTTTGAVNFAYASGSAANFKTYATALTKIS